ncbi:MAG: DUF368 domain-containing protein [Bacilli bacterium]|jgi:putative membrane protein|nr:DUF368 domain-containing protein [Bacilli bacterium]
MEKQEEQKTAQPEKEAKRGWKEWLVDFFKGVAIGLSSNVPGASGGTTAVLVRVYDPMIEAVGNLFHKFKDSFLFLLPIMIGVVLGFGATLKPIELALDAIPFGLSCVFAGLVIAGLPTLYQKVKRVPNWQGIVAFVVSLAFVVGLCFIPGLGNYDLSAITFVGCLLCLVMGIIGSFALVIPGVSGALLLFIFGFYNPIMNLLRDFLGAHQSMGLDTVYIFIFCFGILIGFFLSSKAMGYLLKKYEYVTYMAIIGFIIGSIYAIFHPFIVGVDSMGKFPKGLFPSTLSFGWHLGLGAILLVVSTALFMFFFYLSDKKAKQATKTEEIQK